MNIIFIETTENTVPRLFEKYIFPKETINRIKKRKIVYIGSKTPHFLLKNKISRNEFLKYYLGNEINPNLKTFLDTKTNTGWTTVGHTGVDVEVFAFGAGYQSLMGQIDNTDIAKTIFSFIDKKQPVIIDSDSNKVSEKVSTNIELTSDEDDDGLCDFKEDWRCN